jgi:hypothetical protein
VALDARAASVGAAAGQLPASTVAGERLAVPASCVHFTPKPTKIANGYVDWRLALLTVPVAKSSPIRKGDFEYDQVAIGCEWRGVAGLTSDSDLFVHCFDTEAKLVVGDRSIV